MTLRFNSLKTRTALAMSAVIVAILVANAVYLILTKRAELRKGIEERALTFALPHPRPHLHRVTSPTRTPASTSSAS